MGYVAVQGGITAIENSQKLNRYLRLRGESVAALRSRRSWSRWGPLVDRVMSEGGLYSPFHAALALKQASGDPIEASFLCSRLPIDPAPHGRFPARAHGPHAHPAPDFQRIQDDPRAARCSAPPPITSSASSISPLRRKPRKRSAR